jgi:hypothetical protein
MITCGQCGSTVISGMGHACWSQSQPYTFPWSNGVPTPERPDTRDEIAKLRSDVTILKGMVGALTDKVDELLAQRDHRELMEAFGA